uniref:Uncharacterized protein n=1 Tax=Candidatus Kentrum sp. MB TaxID=2138164 RepID=A0A451B7S9_9GAMM|nr:MAG: hypothetical protein BECKMB1821I_GA0114274_100378 [Candidatus Kentron sp. MB]VFK74348.1 MAG: hypothetical protein BECKMB1821H_GA0114242_100378 [Candidatus Kentron sp. MB]
MNMNMTKGMPFRKDRPRLLLHICFERPKLRIMRPEARPARSLFHLRHVWFLTCQLTTISLKISVADHSNEALPHTFDA